MTKTVTACIGFLLLAMHFSSQVHALNSTSLPPVSKETVTTNITISKGASASLQSSAFTLLIPVAGSLLQGRF